MRIITHAGKCHLDDFLACCLLAYKYNYPIYRVASVDWSSIQDGDIVVDIGGRYEPPYILDHHGDINIRCSLYLVLYHHFGYSFETLDQVKLLRYIDLRDRFGSKKAVQMIFGVEDTPRELNTLEPLVLPLFSERTVIQPDDPLYIVMREIGRKLLELIDRYLMRLLMYKVLIPKVNGNGVKYVIVAEENNPDIQLINEIHDVDVVVSPNSRDPNQTSITVVNDKPVSLDQVYEYFNKQGKVVFYHANRFLIVLDYPVYRLPKEAIELIKFK